MSKHKLFSSFSNSPILDKSPIVGTSVTPVARPKKSQSKFNKTHSSSIVSDSGEEKDKSKMDQSNINKNEHCNPANNENNFTDLDDSFDDFNTKPSLKLPYTRAEDELIVKYVLKGENIFKTASILLWKNLEEKKENPKRTFQSLKNRFLRNIKPSLFTTYRHLIKDKDTEKKILMKFPELKKKYGSEDIISVVTLPNRNLLHDQKQPSAGTNQAASPVRYDVLQEVSERASRILQRSPRQPKKRKQFKTKSVEIKNGSITVTLTGETDRPVTPTQELGIYEKYCRLKADNDSVSCPLCGKLGYEPEEMGSSKSDSVIPNSVETPPKSSRRNGEKTTPTKTDVVRWSPLAGGSKKRKNSESLSPSLLEREEDRGSTEKGSQSQSTTSNSSDKYLINIKSVETLNDKDLDVLYQETVANIEMFMDHCDDEDMEKQNEPEQNFEHFSPIKLRSRSRPDMSADQISVESFFMDADLSTVENLPTKSKDLEKSSNKKNKEHKVAANKKPAVRKAVRKR